MLGHGGGTWNGNGMEGLAGCGSQVGCMISEAASWNFLCASIARWWRFSRASMGLSGIFDRS